MTRKAIRRAPERYLVSWPTNETNDQSTFMIAQLDLGSITILVPTGYYCNVLSRNVKNCKNLFRDRSVLGIEVGSSSEECSFVEYILYDSVCSTDSRFLIKFFIDI